MGFSELTVFRLLFVYCAFLPIMDGDYIAEVSWMRLSPSVLDWLQTVISERGIVDYYFFFSSTMRSLPRGRAVGIDSGFNHFGSMAL